MVLDQIQSNAITCIEFTPPSDLSVQDDWLCFWDLWIHFALTPVDEAKSIGDLAPCWLISLFIVYDIFGEEGLQITVLPLLGFLNQRIAYAKNRPKTFMRPTVKKYCRTGRFRRPLKDSAELSAKGIS